MPYFHPDATAHALNPSPATVAFPGTFADHLEARARNQLHLEAGPARVIEVGEVTAGIAVPERGGVRFFSSERRFDPLDGTVFGSIEQAAKAARDRFRAATQPRAQRRTPGLSTGSKLHAV